MAGWRISQPSTPERGTEGLVGVLAGVDLDLHATRIARKKRELLPCRGTGTSHAVCLHYACKSATSGLVGFEADMEIVRPRGAGFGILDHDSMGMVLWDLDDATLAAAASWCWKPKIKDGVAVEAWQVFSYQWSLR